MSESGRSLRRSQRNQRKGIKKESEELGEMPVIESVNSKKDSEAKQTKESTDDSTQINELNVLNEEIEKKREALEKLDSQIGKKLELAKQDDQLKMQNQMMEIKSQMQQMQEMQQMQQMQLQRPQLDIVPFNKKDPDEEFDESTVANTPFVNKVWRIVNDPQNYDFIRWVPGGKSILIVDREGFEKHLLPLYFKHKRFTSFVRQLNMYGWHKVPDISAGTMQSSDEHWQFSNPNFIQGRPELLQNIVRNRGQKGSAPTAHPAKSIPDPPASTKSNSANTHTNSIVQQTVSPTDIKAVLKELEQIRARQVSIGEDLSRIRKDNDMLWGEYALMRERYDKHSQTLTKIFRFLASLYGNQKRLDGAESSKLIDAINEIDPTYYGLIPPHSVAPSSSNPQDHPYDIHELKEIEELQNEIDNANNATNAETSLVPANRNNSQLVRSFPKTNPMIPHPAIPNSDELDNSFFPDFGDLGKDRRLSAADLPELEKTVQSQGDNLQSIEDWLTKNLPADDMYNVDQFLTPDEEPSKKRKRTE